MILAIDLTPTEEEQVFTLARQTDLAPADYVKKLLQENMPQSELEIKKPLTAENDPAIALLEAWISSAPTDPEEIR